MGFGAQILQSLLQNNGAAQRLPSSWAVDNDTQERGRMYQLQALLSALQVHPCIPKSFQQKLPLRPLRMRLVLEALLLSQNGPSC